jgi:hypothetical protein
MPHLGILGGTAMVEIFATISAWNWPMIAAFLAGGSLVVGFVSLLIVAHTQVIRPWLRRRKLKRPFAAYFSITSRHRFPLEYVVQDDQDHEVKELVVPAHSEITIQIVLYPRLSFLEREIYFGCGENVFDPEKPRAREWFVPFVVEGDRRSRKPDAAHPGHYIDYNGFYHVREDFLYTNDTRVIGFKLLTKAPGNYLAQVFTVTDEIRGKADLVIKVQRPVETKMRCVSKDHRWRRCLITPRDTN